MPHYSDLGHYGTSSPSYSGLYLSSPYSNHSSLSAVSSISPYRVGSSPIFVKPYPRTFARGYSPLLSTISEQALVSSNVGSKFAPKLQLTLHHRASPKFKVPKPIKINTADIDVSVNKYRKYDHSSRPGAIVKTGSSKKEKSPSPSSITSTLPSNSTTTEDAASPTIAPVPAEERKAIRRDRALVRLHTIHKKDSPRKNNIQAPLKSWRDCVYVDEMKLDKPTKELPKKSPGELLKEKHLIKQENEDYIYQKQLGQELQQQNKPTSFHAICRAISSDSINEELNPGQPNEIQRRQSRQYSSNDILAAIRRDSAEILQENIIMLDTLLKEEERMNNIKEDENNNTEIALDAIRVVPKTRKKIVKKKSNEKLNDLDDDDVDINKSTIHRKPTFRKSRRPSADANSKDELHSRDISPVEIEEVKLKAKPVFTATIAIDHLPVLKAKVDKVEIVESPSAKKTASVNKFKFNVAVDAQIHGKPKSDNTNKPVEKIATVLTEEKPSTLPFSTLNINNSHIAAKRERSRSPTVDLLNHMKDIMKNEDESRAPKGSIKKNKSEADIPQINAKKQNIQLSVPATINLNKKPFETTPQDKIVNSTQQTITQVPKVVLPAKTIATLTDNATNIESKSPLPQKFQIKTQSNLEPTKPNFLQPKLPPKEENRSGENFWEKIGTRESVYHGNRKQMLAEKRNAALLAQSLDTTSPSSPPVIATKKLMTPTQKIMLQSKLEDRAKIIKVTNNYLAPSNGKRSEIKEDVALEVESDKNTRTNELLIKNEIPKVDEVAKNAVHESLKLLGKQNIDNVKITKQVTSSGNTVLNDSKEKVVKPKVDDVKNTKQLTSVGNTVLNDSKEKIDEPNIEDVKNNKTAALLKTSPNNSMDKLENSKNVGDTNAKQIIPLGKTEINKLNLSAEFAKMEDKKNSVQITSLLKPTMSDKNGQDKSFSLNTNNSSGTTDFGKKIDIDNTRETKVKPEATKPAASLLKIKSISDQIEIGTKTAKVSELATINNKFQGKLETIPVDKLNGIEIKTNSPITNKITVEPKSDPLETKVKAMTSDNKIDILNSKNPTDPKLIKTCINIDILQKPIVTNPETKNVPLNHNKPKIPSAIKSPPPSTKPPNLKVEAKATQDNTCINKNTLKNTGNLKLSEPEIQPMKKLISKRSLVNKSTVDDPDLQVFEIPDDFEAEQEATAPEPEEPEPTPPTSGCLVPSKSNALFNFTRPFKKPEQLDVCPVEIFAKPKTIRKRHYPAGIRPASSPPPRPAADDSSSEEEEESSSEEEEDNDSDSEEESEEKTCSADEDEIDLDELNDVWGYGKIGASTSSSDSGFESASLPTSRHINCDVNCHKKCEKLTANLCGVNQKLIVEALASVKKGAQDNRDTSAATAQARNNPELDMEELMCSYGDSSVIKLFQRSGRITPPATTIPRFRKYAIEDFTFLKVLGKGSFGKVFLAELKDTEYYYAIKCLKKDVVLEDDDVECTLIERKVLALATKHPYLCHLLCTYQTESHLFFVMEYLNGGDLMFHIQNSGRFVEDRARFYAAEIVSGLKFLHGKGIVYRDLKLDNILLDFDGHVRIADFGMCKLQIFLDRTADTFCGTPDYMAPEIIKGQHYNQSVDWWSFGVLLYEMLIGQSPFSGCDEDELFWSICNEKPVLPRFLSKEASSILTLFLEKDGTKRLGNKCCNHGDIQDQPFFRGLDWNDLENRKLETPFKPDLQHPLDTKYFDTAFTKEEAKLTPIEKHILQSMDQTQFQGFSYTNPNATDR